jgi:hypothetical protein
MAFAEHRVDDEHDALAGVPQPDVAGGMPAQRELLPALIRAQPQPLATAQPDVDRRVAAELALEPAQRLLAQREPVRLEPAVVLAELGVYLGRAKRWNSWVVASQPKQIFRAIAQAPAAPRHVGTALLGTIAFAVVFYLTYRVLTGASTQVRRLAPARGDAEG